MLTSGFGRLPRLLAVCSLSASLALAGCPETETPTPDAAGDAGDTDAGPTGRSYLLGGLAQKYEYNTARRWTISLDKLTAPAPADGSGEPVDLTEMVVVPLYHLGIPWTEFDSSFASTLPGPWVQAINDVAAAVAGLNKPIAIALSPTSLEWDNLAPEARDNGSGGLQIQENWLQSYCHDPSQDGDPKQWEAAYVRYVEWITDKFDPAYVFVAHRINRYDEVCSGVNPNAYAAIANFATAAHEAIKARSNPPTTVVTVDVEDLYGFTVAGKPPGRCVVESPKECFEQRKNLLDAFTADRLGLESYPGDTLRFTQDIPADWLDVVAAYRSDMPPLIAGTGLGAVRMETNAAAVCLPLLETSQQLQLQWLDQVFGVADKYDMELVVWNSPVDQLSAQLMAPCDCTGDFEICEHLSQLGGNADAVRLQLIEGLFPDEGSPREAGIVWQQALTQ